MAIANQTKTIVGVFNSVGDAHAAVRDLEALGIARDEISVVANKNAAGYETMESRDKASDVVADAGIGAAIGGVGGLLLSAAGALTVPVIGPILAAGPIAAALTGAGIGAAAGGAIKGGKGAGIGAGAGAGMGALTGFLTDRNLRLQKGTTLEVRLDHPLQVPQH